MRPLLLAFLAANVAVAHAENPPKRTKGFFGFGAPPSDQISGDLFPQSGGGSPLSRKAASANSRDEGIFRGGKPQKVEPVSYVIEDGRRVEKPLPVAIETATERPTAKPTKEKALSKPTVAEPLPDAVLAATVAGEEKEKKRGWFGFGKREADPVVAPVPVAAPLLTASPVAPAPAPPVAKPAVAPAPKPVPVAAPLPSAVPQEAAEAPAFAEAEREKSFRIPFFGRKKAEVPAPAPPVAVEIPTAVPVPIETAAAPAPKPSSSKPTSSEKPAAKPGTPEVATFEIRRDDTKPAPAKKEEKPERDGGLLAPVAKLRPPKKEIDLTGAETIIQNGQIVGESESSFTAASEPKPSGPRQAPQVVNGVTTYTSWDDVNAASTTAADRILNRLR